MTEVVKLEKPRLDNHSAPKYGYLIRGKIVPSKGRQGGTYFNPDAIEEMVAELPLAYRESGRQLLLSGKADQFEKLKKKR